MPSLVLAREFPVIETGLKNPVKLEGKAVNESPPPTAENVNSETTVLPGEADSAETGFPSVASGGFLAQNETLPEVSENPGVEPFVLTNKQDYAPGETVRLIGENFSSNSQLNIKITRPDGSVVKGDGSFEPGIDTVETDEQGKFEYSYILNGVEGEYLVEVLDQEGTVLATKTFTDSPKRLGEDGFDFDCGVICPDGNVKYDIGGSRYEYTDDTAAVTVTPGSGEVKNSVAWEPVEGYEIVGVCLKIGGPCGGSLKDGLAQGGGPFEYDISHVVLITEPLPTVTPTPALPVCEQSKWTCEECQSLLTQDDLCFNDFVEYCGENYGCELISSCRESRWACRDTCQEEPHCGDGLVNQDYEECDDGNNADGDGCSSDCLWEELDSCSVDLGLTKTASTDGRTVTFTLVVTNLTDSTVKGVELKDRLSRGFRYSAGSALVDGSSVSDPVINGSWDTTGQLLTWPIGDIGPGQEASLEFRAEIESDLPNGEYPNLAYALGYCQPGSGRESQIGYSDYAFATVKIQEYDWPSTKIEGQVLGVSAQVEGQVLGAATGAETIWLILALVMIGGGLVMVDLSGQKSLGMRLFRLGKRVPLWLTAAVIFGCLAGTVQAVESLYVRLEALPEYSPSDYIDLYYNTLERENRAVEVRCYLREDGGFGWRQFDETQTSPAGVCRTSNDDFEEDGLYFFKAVATSADGTSESNETYTTLDRVRPESVKDYRKTRTSSMTYELHWRTPDNGDFKFVRVYASLEQNFTANDSTRWDDIHGSPDEEFDHVFGGFEPDKEYFFALQAFDKTGHYSDLAGDGGVLTYETVEESAGQSVAVTAPVAVADGEVLGEEAVGEVDEASSESDFEEATEPAEEEAGETENDLLSLIRDEEGKINWPVVIGGSLLLSAGGAYWVVQRRQNQNP